MNYDKVVQNLHLFRLSILVYNEELAACLEKIVSPDVCTEVHDLHHLCSYNIEALYADVRHRCLLKSLIFYPMVLPQRRVKISYSRTTEPSKLDSQPVAIPSDATLLV